MLRWSKFASLCLIHQDILGYLEWQPWLDLMSHSKSWSAWWRSCRGHTNIGWFPLCGKHWTYLSDRMPKESQMLQLNLFPYLELVALFSIKCCWALHLSDWFSSWVYMKICSSCCLCCSTDCACNWCGADVAVNGISSASCAKLLLTMSNAFAMLLSDGVMSCA